MVRSILFASISAGPLLLINPVAQARDLRDIELRRLLEPTAAEVRAEHAGRVYIYDGLQETDIARAMQEQFERLDSMMFIRVQPASAPPQQNQGGEPAPVYYQNDGC